MLSANVAIDILGVVNLCARKDRIPRSTMGQNSSWARIPQRNRVWRRAMKPFWPSLTLLGLTLLTVCSPAAEPTQAQITIIQPGIEAEQRGDYGFALFTYRYWAHLNVALAQYRLARLYAHGLGTNRDATEAAKWYRAASATGYQPAHMPLARLYEQGRGVPKDEALAFALYLRAAAAGDPGAHYQVGRRLELGHGTTVNRRAAAAHYRIAAKAGNIAAQLALAELAPTDRAAPEQVARDGIGHQAAPAHGAAGAHHELPSLPAQGERMTTLEAKGAVQLVAVRDEIQERLLKFNLPVEDLAGGSFAEQETVTGAAAAAARYRETAQQGDGLAAFKLAQAFEQGQGVPPDLVEALTWYGIAQLQGYAAATPHVDALRDELPSVEAQEASSRIDQWWRKFGSS
jgi:TPR repeat protein